jgi:DNA-binding NarL/FixJ family response regulator
MRPVSQIVVIEDQAIVSGLVERVAGEVFPRAKIHVAASAQAGLDACRAHQPEIVVLDVELPDGDGLDLVQRIRSDVAGVRVLLLTAHTEPYILHRAQQANVDGFVDKNRQTPEMMAEALRAVAQGRRLFSSGVTEALAEERADPRSFSKRLSDREQELLRHFGLGASDQEIAERFQLSQHTVRNHRRNIMAKIEVHSTPELIRYAVENGFARFRRAGR